MKKLRYAMFCFILYAFWLYPDAVFHYHTVKKGESLSSISRKYNVEVASIKNLNNMKNSVIYPNQRLIVKKLVSSTDIQKDNRSSKNPDNVIYYKVEKGDNLYKISKKFNISVSSIKKLNNLKSNTLLVGKTLKVSFARKVPPSLPSIENPTPIISVSDKIYYTVKKGETLQGLANQFGVTVDELKRTNLLDEKDFKEGQILVIQKEEMPVESELSDAGQDYELSLRERIIQAAYDYIGTPYKLGGKGEIGIDCSTLTRIVYGNIGISLPATSHLQYKEGIYVNLEDAVPGDLVFFKRGGYVYHVGIYIGDNLFIHASSSQRQVTIASLNNTYFKQHFAAVRRYIPLEEGNLASKFENVNDK